MIEWHLTKKLVYLIVLYIGCRIIKIRTDKM